MRIRIAAVLLTGLLAGACAQAPTLPAQPTPGAPEGFPADGYAQAAARGEPVFRVDPEHSLVVIRVYRAGALARFGHDHVVATRDVRGFMLLAGAGTGRADLYAPLASLSVDEPALRAQAGFDTQPSQQDIEGTRRNMLDKELDAARYPFVTLHLESTGGAPPNISVSAAITLHGQTRTVPVSVELETPSAQTVYARGRFSVKQTDLGLAPYSLFGGALQVADPVDIEFSLSATRM